MFDFESMACPVLFIFRTRLGFWDGLPGCSGRFLLDLFELGPYLTVCFLGLGADSCKKNLAPPLPTLGAGTTGGVIWKRLRPP